MNTSTRKYNPSPNSLVAESFGMKQFMTTNTTISVRTKKQSPPLPQKYLPQYYKVQRYAMPVFLIVVLLVPYVLHFNPIGIYLDATAGNVFDLLFSFGR